jgi:hypothetical protein
MLYRASDGSGIIAGAGGVKTLYYSAPAYFRRGYKYVLDENWEPIECYKEYGINETRIIDYDAWVVNPERSPYNYAPLANPITTVLDAYNSYYTSYNEEDSNNSPYTQFENTDNDIFEARLKPRGSLTLFRSRNPITGDINIMPFPIFTRAGTSGTGIPMALKGSGNPYTGNYKEIEYEVLVQSGTDQLGNAIYTTIK